MLAAPLWDSVQCQFVGLLTVIDFIDILCHYRATNNDISSLAVVSIAEILNGNNIHDCVNPAHHDQPKNKTTMLRNFQGADSNCTLQQACEQLLSSGQDFLPIVFAEDMRVLACITYTNILEHLVTHFREQRRLFDDSITDLGIGTYGSAVVVVHAQQSLADALHLMQERGLSAVPVVDNLTSRKIMGVYSRSDITFLTKATDAADAVRNLNLPLSEILSQTRHDVTTPDALRCCSPTHTLQAVFESFAQIRFNRLYVVDANECLLGVVSAKDLVAYFLSDKGCDSDANNSNEEEC